MDESKAIDVTFCPDEVLSLYDALSRLSVVRKKEGCFTDGDVNLYSVHEKLRTAILSRLKGVDVPVRPGAACVHGFEHDHGSFDEY